jgi:hypothetical protein
MNTQLAEDDAGILAAAVALAWDQRVVLMAADVQTAPIDAEMWWAAHSQNDQRRYLRQARTACEAWENFWKEHGR